MNRLVTRHSETGAVLVVGLVFLLAITVIGVAGIRTSMTENRMAVHAESRVSAFESAMALGDAILATPSVTPVTGGAGHTNCTPGEAGCDANDIVLPGGLFSDEIAGGHLKARVVRLTPEVRPPPRGLGSSIDKFDAAPLEVRTTFDRSQEGLGRSEIVEGILMLVPRN